MFGIIVAILSILAFVYFTYRRYAGYLRVQGKSEGSALPGCHGCESCRLHAQCDKTHRDEENNSDRSLPLLIALVFCLVFFPGCGKKMEKGGSVQNEMETVDPYEIREEKGYAILTDANFFVAVKENDLLLVDCWMNHCPPCEAQGEILDRIIKQYQGQVKFAKYHHDTNGKRSIDYSLRMFPTLLLFKDGKLKEFLIGLQFERNLQKILDAELGMEQQPDAEPVEQTEMSDSDDVQDEPAM